MWEMVRRPFSHKSSLILKSIARVLEKAQWKASLQRRRIKAVLPTPNHLCMGWNLGCGSRGEKGSDDRDEREGK